MDEKGSHGKGEVSAETEKIVKKHGPKKKVKSVIDGGTKAKNVVKIHNTDKSPEEKIGSGADKVEMSEDAVERDVPSKEEEKKESQASAKSGNAEKLKTLATRGKKREWVDTKIAKQFLSSEESMSRLRPRNQFPSFQKVSLCEGDYSRVVGKRIKVFWPDEKKWFAGRVDSFDNKKKLHQILYDDGDKEMLELRAERFELEILPNEVFGKSDQEKETGPESEKKKKKIGSSSMEIDGETEKGDGKKKSGEFTKDRLAEERTELAKKRAKASKPAPKVAQKGSLKGEKKDIVKATAQKKDVNTETREQVSGECDNLDKPALSVVESVGQSKDNTGGKQCDQTDTPINNSSETHVISDDTKAKQDTGSQSQELQVAVPKEEKPRTETDQTVKGEAEEKKMGENKALQGAADQAKKVEGQLNVTSQRTMDKKDRGKSNRKK